MLAMVAHQTIKTSKAQISIIEDNICYFHYQENTHLELDDYLENHKVYNELNVDQNLKILAEFPKHVSFSVEARKYAEMAALDTIAQAIVIHSLPQRIIARFYHRMRKNDFPVKVFNKKHEAVAWLLTF